MDRGRDRAMDRGKDRAMDRGRDKAMDRGKDRAMDRGRDRAMDREQDRAAGRGVALGIRKRNVFSHAMRRGKPDLTRRWKGRKTKADRPA